MASRNNWECSLCNGINGERDVTCNSCGQHRKDGDHYSRRKSSSGRRGGRNGVKYDWDSVSRGRGQSSDRGSDDPPPKRYGARTRYDDQAGSPWKCSECTYYNKTASHKCTMCHKSTRPGDQRVYSSRSGADQEYSTRYGGPQGGPSRYGGQQGGSSRSGTEQEYSTRSGGPQSGPSCYNGQQGGSSRPRETQVCPRGPPHDDRMRYPHRPPSPSYKENNPPVSRNPDRSSQNRRWTQEDDRRPRRARTARTPSPGPFNDSTPSSRNPRSNPRSRNNNKPVWDECVDSKERRLVLLGKTGSGKSATGNSILSGDYFRSQISGVSITRACRRGVVQRNGKEIHVVDTPGIFDTDVDNDETTKEIVKCIGITAPGPHAFILVLRIGRFTQEERDSVEHFIESFGKSVEKYMIVLFTGMDSLHDERMTLDDHLRRIPSGLASVLKRCRGRCVGFNNKGTSQEVSRQVDELMEMVEELYETNQGRYYTNDMYTEAENVIRMREAEIKSMAEENKRRDIEKLVDENDRYHRQMLQKYEEQQYELERKLREAESRESKTGRDRRQRTEKIDKDVRSIRAQIEGERRAGRKVSQRLQNSLLDLEAERDRIVKTDASVKKMQTDIETLRQQLQGMKRKVSNARREQNDDKEKRLKELEKKYAESENATREVVRKEVESGKMGIGDQLLTTVIGLGKAIWKGLTKIF
ncbi:uncharacterized protein [Argopecten irradians]|uniref:uncharacterized protein isoform X2 n=1 Tax=Argopecten irradians TaxID=31199 RepID=UPI00371B9DE0